MQHVTQLATAALLGLLILTWSSAGLGQTDTAAPEATPGLFINLTSDDVNRAAMAINFATKVREVREMPVTLFLNVDAVRLADTSIPETAYATGSTPREMLSDFMELGGTVIICPMCMENVGGIERDQLMEGVILGGPDTTWPALFAPNTTVLSY